MKNLIILLCLLFVVTACEKPTEVAKASVETAIDTKAIETAVSAVVDKNYEFSKTMDETLGATLMAKNAVIYGTDPKEIWDYNTLFESMDSYKKDPDLAAFLENLSFEKLDRQIGISPDGKWAVVTDLVKASFSKMPMRSTIILNNQNGNWKITYANNAFVIKNEDLAKVDAILE